MRLLQLTGNIRIILLSRLVENNPDNNSFCINDKLWRMERFTKKATLVECESLNNVHVIENSKKRELKHNKTKTSCDFNRKRLMWQTDGTRQKQKQYNNDAYQQITEKKKNWNIENS